MTTTLEERIKNDDLFQSAVRWSNIPIITYKTHRLQTFLPSRGSKSAYQTALNFISGKAKHHFLTFVSEPGRGKTHLALGIGWHWLENKIGLVKYYQVESLLDQLRQGFSADTEERLSNFDHLRNQVETASLLILDDLGVEQSTPWAEAKLDEIIDYRYLNQLPTVFTTNLNPMKLSPRIASRLSEGIIIVLLGKDYRNTKAKMRGEQ